MAPISLLLPPALLLAGGLLTLGLRGVGVELGRLPVALAVWLALVALIGVWALARAPLEVTGPALGAGVRGDLRLDGLAVAIMGMVLFTGAVLLSAEPRPALESATSCAALAGSCLALEATAVPLTALALGASAVLLLVAQRAGSAREPSAAFSIWQAAAWLVLLWAGATLQAMTGTASYEAIPVTSFGVPTFLLLAGSALLVAGLTPWKSWVVDVLVRRRPASALAVAALPPVGFYLLLRGYDAGGGRYPSAWLNLGLAALGLAVTAGAAFRAQAAGNRRTFLAELVPANAGFALFALALGSPLGVSAALVVLCGQALLVALLALLPEVGRSPLRIALLAALGAPPGLIFGARLLAIEAGFDAGGAAGLLTIGLAAAWLLTLAGAVRAMALAPAAASRPRPGRPALSTGLAILAVASGVGLGVIQLAVAVPAAAEVVSFPAGAAGSRLVALTASGAWAAVGFGAPLLLLGAAAFYLGRSQLSAAAATGGSQAAEGPTAVLHSARAEGLQRSLTAVRQLRVPEEYRSLLDVRALDATVSAGRPLLWLFVVAALAYAISR